MKRYGEVEALDEGKWSASDFGRISPGTHLEGGGVGPRIGLDAVAKRKKSSTCPSWKSNTGRLFQPVAQSVY
jgi:hypothetical protein